MTGRAPIPLAADVEAALRRLRLAAIRREAPEVLATAKAQRWTPEEVLRVLVEAEITSRDASCGSCSRRNDGYLGARGCRISDGAESVG